MEIDQNTPHRVRLNPEKRKRGPQGTAKNGPKKSKKQRTSKKDTKKGSRPPNKGKKAKSSKKGKTQTRGRTPAARGRGRASRGRGSHTSNSTRKPRSSQGCSQSRRRARYLLMFLLKIISAFLRLFIVCSTLELTINSPPFLRLNSSKKRGKQPAK